MLPIHTMFGKRKAFNNDMRRRHKISKAKKEGPKKALGNLTKAFSLQKQGRGVLKIRDKINILQSKNIESQHRGEFKLTRNHTALSYSRLHNSVYIKCKRKAQKRRKSPKRLAFAFEVRYIKIPPRSEFETAYYVITLNILSKR